MLTTLHVKTATEVFVRLPQGGQKTLGPRQEDVFPVAQFEKLWGDMTALTGVTNAFALVPRQRGQQLKDQAQLDGWQRDGSAAHVAGLCDWG